MQENTILVNKRILGITALAIAAIAILGLLWLRVNNLTFEDPLLLDSTIGELAIWMSDQTQEDEIESALGNFAENWAQSRGEDVLDAEILLYAMQNGLQIGISILVILTLIALITLYLRPTTSRLWFLIVLLGINILLFIFPVMDGDHTSTLVLVLISLLLVILLASPGPVTKVLGFFVVLSFLFVAWESSKALAAMVNFKITIPQPSWEYETYPTIDAMLIALDEGDIDAVIYDRRDLSDMMPVYPPDRDEEITNDLAYPNLRYLNDLDDTTSVLFFSIEPDFPGRLKVAVRSEDVDNWSSVLDAMDVSLGTVAGEFADERFLAAPRQLLIVDLKILNDINLPHLQTIAEALLQPARRNGSQLLIRILGAAAWFTFGEAALGFSFGAVFGLILGTVFAHSQIMERSLLPYVVASQTVPILAIAPMIVIWLGASQLSVAVIAMYLTFFPVTINTLRGLRAPSQAQIDLMRSYAAHDWTILWKLRFPAALPYVFTALKVSATASVVGAIIGELPSGIGDGLGRAILDFSSDYSLISTPKLWGAIIVAASVGIFFFIGVSLVERLVLGRYVRNL